MTFYIPMTAICLKAISLPSFKLIIDFIACLDHILLGVEKHLKSGRGGGCFQPALPNFFVFKVRLVKFYTELLLDKMNILRQKIQVKSIMMSL